MNGLMCVCTPVRHYTHMYVCVFACVFACALCMCMYAYVLYVCVCVCLCMYAYACVCVYVCVYVCVCMSMCLYIQYIHMHTYRFTCTVGLNATKKLNTSLLNLCVYMHVYVYIYLYIYTDVSNPWPTVNASFPTALCMPCIHIYRPVYFTVQFVFYSAVQTTDMSLYIFCYNIHKPTLNQNYTGEDHGQLGKHIRKGSWFRA